MKLIAIGLAGVALVGCCPKRPPLQAVSDQQVVNRCAPVTDLLAKNYKRQSAADLLLVNAGSLTEETGAILSSAEATRVFELDAACRAWVSGALSDDRYVDVMLSLLSVTIVQTSKPEERAAVAKENADGITALAGKGIIPPTADGAQLAAKVTADSARPPEGLDKEIRSAIGKLGESVDQNAIAEARFRDLVISRLAILDSRLPRQTDPQSTARADLEVYFSTGSAELTRDARLNIRAAAETWVRERKRVRILGFTDPRGNASKNARLSEARANAVGALLIRIGVPVIEVRGSGAAQGDEDDALRVVRISAE